MDGTSLAIDVTEETVAETDRLGDEIAEPSAHLDAAIAVPPLIPWTPS